MTKELKDTLIKMLTKYFNTKIELYLQIALETHNHKKLKELETLLNSFINYDSQETIKTYQKIRSL